MQCVLFIYKRVQCLTPVAGVGRVSDSLMVSNPNGLPGSSEELRLQNRHKSHNYIRPD